MSEKVNNSAQEQVRRQRGLEIIDFARTGAELSVLFDDDETAAKHLAELKRKILIVDKPEEGSDYKLTVETQIQYLQPDSLGILSLKGKELVSDFREMTKETVIAIGIRGDTSGLVEQYGDHLGGQMIERYTRLAEECVKTAGPQ